MVGRVPLVADLKDAPKEDAATTFESDTKRKHGTSAELLRSVRVPRVRIFVATSISKNRPHNCGSGSLYANQGTKFIKTENLNGN